MKKTLVLILTIILLSTAAALIYRQSGNSILPSINRGVKFTGTITEVNNECYSDGTCSVKVDDKSIIREYGGLRPPNSKVEVKGRLLGFFNAEISSKNIGNKVEVFAQPTASGNYTLYGNSDYYIKLLE